jgi:hypothetical protein
MGLDVRLPIGLLFSAIGIALVVYGFVSDAEIYQKSLGVNVNLLWGVVLVVFGALMLFLGMRHKPSRLSASTRADRESSVAS